MDPNAWLDAAAPPAPQSNASDWLGAALEPEKQQARTTANAISTDWTQPEHIQGLLSSYPSTTLGQVTGIHGPEWVQGNAKNSVDASTYEGDEGARKWAQFYSKQYADTLTAAGLPSDDVSQRQKQWEDTAFKAHREYQLDAWQQAHAEFNHYAGTASDPTYIGQTAMNAAFGLHKFLSGRSYSQAVENFQKGQATPEDYGVISSQMNRQRAAKEDPTPWLTPAGQTAASLAKWTAAQVIPGGNLLAAASEVPGVIGQGYEAQAQGGSFGGTVAKGLAGVGIDTAAMKGLSVLGKLPKTMMGQMVTRAMGDAAMVEAEPDIKRMLGLGEGGPLLQAASGDVEQAKNTFMSQTLPMLMFSAGHAVMPMLGGKQIDPQKLAQATAEVMKEEADVRNATPTPNPTNAAPPGNDATANGPARPNDANAQGATSPEGVLTSSPGSQDSGQVHEAGQGAQVERTPGQDTEHPPSQPGQAWVTEGTEPSWRRPDLPRTTGGEANGPASGEPSGPTGNATGQQPRASATLPRAGTGLLDDEIGTNGIPRPAGSAINAPGATISTEGGQGPTSEPVDASTGQEGRMGGPGAAGIGPDFSRAAGGQLDLPSFARVVTGLARSSEPSQRFFDNKAYIGDLWRESQDDPNFPQMTLDEFKQKLLAANQQHLLHLSRIDLGKFADPQKMKESEITIPGSDPYAPQAQFHTVLIDQPPRRGPDYSQAATSYKRTATQTQPPAQSKMVQAPVGTGSYQTTADALDHYNAAEKRNVARAENDLASALAHFQAYTEAAPNKATALQRFLEFTDPYQNGQRHANPKFQQFAATLRKHWAEAESALVVRGELKHVEQNHLKQMWKDPLNPNMTPEELSARLMQARRPLAGREGFKHAKTYQDFRAGIAAGLEPVSLNPIEIQLMGLREAWKSVFAHDLQTDIAQHGRRVFVPIGKRGPSEYAPLDDKSAKVFAPPEVPVSEFYDMGKRKGLEDFARSIGVDPTQRMHGAPGEHTRGPVLTNPRSMVQVHGAGQISTRFGATDKTLAHELWHELDARYNIGQKLLGHPLIGPELEAMAAQRYAGITPKPEFKTYVHNPREKIANMGDAYLNTPELLDTLAPNAKAWIDKFLERPELKALKAVKPSLVLGKNEQMLRLAGPQFVGQYWYPKEDVKLLENHVAKGLQGNKVYDTYRAAGNFMNMMTLGFSGFHAGFTALNSQIQSGSQLIQRLSRLPYQALTGKLSKGTLGGIARDTAGTAVPLLSTARSLVKGGKMGAEYYNPGKGSPQTRQDVEGMVAGGGRARMDKFYGLGSIDKVMKAQRQLRAGGALEGSAAIKAVTHAIPALSEAVLKPILDYQVPMAKRTAIADMMAIEREKLGPNATTDQLREAYGKVVDSVDNRFGEMIYDNTHMNRTAKDLLMATLRAVGWNMGTWREAGGAVKDIPSSIRGLFNGQGISPRVAYQMSLLATTGMMGTAIGYMLTGKWPQELKDVWFPKTGKKAKDGTDERVAPPSYMKDYAGIANGVTSDPMAVPKNVLDMLGNKVHPLLSTAYHLGKNKDYFDEPIVTKGYSAESAGQLGKYLGKQLMPFSVTGTMRNREQGQSWGKAMLPMVGVTNAPGYIRRTPEQQKTVETKGSFYRSLKDMKSQGLLKKKRSTNYAGTP